MICGIDISESQGIIDWETIVNSDVGFAFIRATKKDHAKPGVLPDNNLYLNGRGAIENKISLGFYHSWNPDLPGDDQAREFIKIINDNLLVDYNSYERKLPPALWLEESKISDSDLESEIHKFIGVIMKCYGPKPIIFTSKKFWTKYLSDRSIWINKYEHALILWVKEHTQQFPGVFYPFVNSKFWQFTNEARIPGISGNVNLNWFFGTRYEINTLDIHQWKNLKTYS